MPRGLGAIERAILEIVADKRLWSGFAGVPTRTIQNEIALRRGLESITPALEASVRRACKSLERKGLIAGIQSGRMIDWSPAAPDDFAGTFGDGMNEFIGASENSPEIATKDRQRLIKLLGMLGSDSDNERANAGLMIDKELKRLGLTWEALIHLR